MTKNPGTPSLTTPEPASLIARYGHLQEASTLTEDQQVQIMTMLWHVLVPIVDLGFRVKPGDKLFEGAEVGADDVVYSVVTAGLAASAESIPKNNKKETP